MRWVIWIVVALGIIVGLIALIGSQLPKGHTLARTAGVRRPPDVLYTLLSDVDGYRTWRSDVKRLERLPDREGHPSWVEDTSSGKVEIDFEGVGWASLLVLRV